MQQLLGTFLFSTLREHGVEHCFGIPGDYILPLYDALTRVSGIEAVVGTHEPCAAFSADAYGRQRGLGAVLVTYGVGGFNALNGVAGAYAECSPLLVVSGGPPRGYVAGENIFVPTRHHVVRTVSDQLEVFRRVTDMAVRIESGDEAAGLIRGAIRHAMAAQRPVYLEIPTDLMATTIDVAPDASAARTDHPDLETAIETAVSRWVDRITAAHRPILLLGVEVARHRLQADIRRIMARRSIPATTSLLAKGLLTDHTPGALGVYAGVLTPSTELRRLVEESDLVIMLGSRMTDVDCGAYTANLHRDRLLVAQVGWVGDGHSRSATDIPFVDFVRALARRLPAAAPAPWPEVPDFDYARSDSLMDRYLGVVASQLGPADVVVADTGDCSFGSLFMPVHRQAGYVAPIAYSTMGFAVPAALGVQLADPGCRPFVLVGDGSFQMTGLELSNMVRRRLDPIVLVFNNGGFGMQRVFVDGPFNDLGAWDYQQVPALLGGGWAVRVSTPNDLAAALQQARAYRGGPTLVEVTIQKGIISTGLKRFGQALARERTGVCPLRRHDATGPCDREDHCGFCRAAIWQ